MRKSTLVVATCQFPISADISANAKYVLGQMGIARERGAHLAHFSECCLSGYAGMELKSTKEIDWELLRGETEGIMAEAARLKLWVALGSMRRLTGAHKPHISLYVIDPCGRVVNRYDKVFCAGRGGARPTEELVHHTPGSRLVTFEVRGVRIGLQVCHDFRYPELYRQYKKLGAELVLHSFHMARMKKHEVAQYYDDHTTFTLQAAAVANHLWISVNNCSTPLAWPSFVVNPAGVVVGRLPRHRAGVLIAEIDPSERFYDPSVYWRERAIDGVLHSGKLVRDRRSEDRTSL